MAALLLTPANLRTVKTRLREICPAIKSAHLSEALAAACGFRTHAALLAALKDAPDRYPPLARTSEQRFAERLRDFRAECSVPLTKLVRDILPDPVWQAFPRRDRAANDNWFYSCQRRNIPFVYLHIGRKYWRLNWDCISTEDNYDGHVRGDAGNELMRAMFRQFQDRARHDPSKAFFEGSAFVGDVKRLLPETARELADDFFAILYSPVRAA
ncbi:hypothetical protein EB810_15285 [Altererythrobacter sp. FM1]|nr:hypothetical protein EB810_15285 [Altererythrobacter sp. FM1]